MTLGAKFNITLLVVFSAGLAIAAAIVRGQVGANARREAVDTAGLMMESAAAIRKYTSEQIRPLLIKDLGDTFHPQTVPAYSATEMFGSLREKHPDITYKEATLNPSNPRDKATDWEADVVEHFRNRPEETEFSGERQSATGPALFVARPIKVSDRACLQCHGDPKDLPKTVADKYGTQAGLGWTMNEIVGAQIAVVPTRIPDTRADSEFRTFLAALVAVFLGLMVVINVLLNRIVIAPIRKIAARADQISTGDVTGPELDANGKDEVAGLAASFNRMTRSLKKAMEMIDRG